MKTMLLFLAPLLLSQPEPTPAQDPIRLPEPEVLAPVTPPAPAPAAGLITLTPNTVYVFDADVPIVVMASPKELVTIEKDTGPIKIGDYFAENASGRKTTRHYKGKEVYTIRAAPNAEGIVEIFAVPIGLKSENEIRRKRLEVKSGQAPKPPPKASLTATPASVPLGGQSVLTWSTENATTVTLDSTPVAPAGNLTRIPTANESHTLVATGPGGTVTATATILVNQPPPPPAVTNPFGDVPGLRVLMVYENSKPLPLGQGPVMFGEKVRNLLDANVPKRPEDNNPEYRIWDKDQKGVENETKLWQDAFAKAKAAGQVPWMLIGNGKVGESVPLPANEDAAVVLIQKYINP